MRFSRFVHTLSCMCNVTWCAFWGVHQVNSHLVYLCVCVCVCLFRYISHFFIYSYVNYFRFRFSTLFKNTIVFPSVFPNVVYWFSWSQSVSCMTTGRIVSNRSEIWNKVKGSNSYLRTTFLAHPLLFHFGSWICKHTHTHNWTRLQPLQGHKFG